MPRAGHGNLVWFLSRPSLEVGALDCVCPACVFEGRPLTKGDTWGPSSFPGTLLPLLTTHSLLRDARGKGYRVQSPAEFTVFLLILIPNPFHVLAAHSYCPDTKIENICNYDQYNRKGTGLKFKRPEFYPLQFLHALCKCSQPLLFSCP